MPVPLSLVKALRLAIMCLALACIFGSRLSTICFGFQLYLLCFVSNIFALGYAMMGSAFLFISCMLLGNIQWGHNGYKYFIVLFHVSGHLEQFGGVLFVSEQLIILVEWGTPPPPCGK